MKAVDYGPDEAPHVVDLHHRTCLGMLDAITMCPWDSHRLKQGPHAFLLLAEYTHEQIRFIVAFGGDTLEWHDASEHHFQWLRFKLEQHAMLQRQWVLADYSHIKAVEYFGRATYNRGLHFTSTDKCWQLCDPGHGLPVWVGLLHRDAVVQLLHDKRYGCLACDVSKSLAPLASSRVLGTEFRQPTLGSRLLGQYHPLSTTSAQWHLLEKYQAMVLTVKKYEMLTGVRRSGSNASVGLVVRRMTGVPQMIVMSDIVWHNSARERQKRRRIVVGSHPPASSTHDEPARLAEDDEPPMEMLITL